jgi:hypothetical protein
MFIKGLPTRKMPSELGRWEFLKLPPSSWRGRLARTMSHDLLKTHASFDDPNLVSRAGLVPLLALAQKAGLADLAGAQVSTRGPCGVNADLKVACLVAGMAAGADSIDDLYVLRYGAMDELGFRQWVEQQE